MILIQMILIKYEEIEFVKELSLKISKQVKIMKTFSYFLKALQRNLKYEKQHFLHQIMNLKHSSKKELLSMVQQTIQYIMYSMMFHNIVLKF